MIDPKKATVGIYGIQDRDVFDHPYFVHDHSIVVMENGRVKDFLELERYTGKKNDNRMHFYIDDLVSQKKLFDPNKFDLVFTDNVVGRCFISSTGKIRFEGESISHLPVDPKQTKCWWFGKQTNAYGISHELAHVFSCLPFCGKFKNNSLLVHFDGGASVSNFSAWIYKNGKVKLIEANWDLKTISSFFNANALSFAAVKSKMAEQNSVPGKLMGLSAFGKYRSEIEEWLREHNYFQDAWHSKKHFYREAASRFNQEKNHIDNTEPFIQDIMATMQLMFEKKLIKKLRQLQEKTNARFLYYTGGSALNIKTNSLLETEALFDEIFIPPCTNDSGLALGAASYLEFLKHRQIAYHTPYINNWGIEEYQVSYSLKDIEIIAEILLQKKVLGICNSYSETGPRALGNRSIIALANSKTLAEKVSRKCKKREWYRPLAPVMLEKNLAYFTGKQEISKLSKYMLRDFHILPDRYDEIKGALHIDRTARIQTIAKKEENPFLYDLLSYLDQEKMLKALINTSFNQRGKPMVHSTKDAFRSAVNMGLNGVILNGKLFLL